MKSNRVSNIKLIGSLYFTMFTLTTIASSIIQLARHQVNDTNLHIINRAVVVFIGALSIVLFDKFFFINKQLSWLIAYAISMGTVFAYVWFCGLFEELSRYAYRDIFLNYTAIVVIVSGFTSLKNKLLKK